ncbi:MAG: hypothetical protein JXR65_12335 [Bacteroidales bacterium]|nr:hypothetical protein [Bacteroidales bacterium]
MEDIITYIIVFGIGFGMLGLYMFQKDKKRILPLSKQLYSDGILTISVIKEQKKVKELMLQMTFIKNAQTINTIFVELVNKKKETLNLNITNLLSQQEEISETPFVFSGTISFAVFKEQVQQTDFKFESFKFAVETTQEKKYKSHALGLHDWWTILKLDSGTYN